MGPSAIVADLSGTSKLSILSAVTVDPFCSPCANNGTSSIFLMQHFQRHWTDIFQLPRSSEIISLSKSNSLVRNTILAISACHLRHVSPGVLQHRIAEHFQQALALRDYQQALDTPCEKLGQAGVDALLLSAALLNILAFALPESEIGDSSGGDEPDPSTSWVFSPREDRLSWLGLQVGIKSLLRSTAAYLDKTMNFLGPIFLGAKRESWTFGGADRGLEGIPEMWIKVFELDGAGYSCTSETASFTGTDKTTHEGGVAVAKSKLGNVFQAPVMTLMRLRNLEIVRLNEFKNLQLLGKVQQEFLALLYDRDERTLWLFGYWLGLMCRFEGMWWCDKRVRMDYKAICMWLEQVHLADRPGVEGETWREMMKELYLAPVFVPNLERC